MVGKPRIGSWPAFGYGVGASNVARRARNARALGAVGAGRPPSSILGRDRVFAGYALTVAFA
jgi:hypothetical protein